jgi:uncharacterized membrane protein YphA (DoxX/SURF4 family)
MKETSMNILLWVLQALLAAAFLAHGIFFLFPPGSMLELLKPIPTALRLFLGVAEVLAAIGLMLPGMTRIQPWLVSLAAAGVMVIMIGATVFHITRGEASSAMTTAVLLAMASFVAYMRWKVRPILPRTLA